MLSASYGWSAVFTLIIGLNIVAASLAIFVLKPLRRRYLAEEPVAAAEAGEGPGPPPGLVARRVGGVPARTRSSETVLSENLVYRIPKAVRQISAATPPASIAGLGWHRHHNNHLGGP